VGNARRGRRDRAAHRDPGGAPPRDPETDKIIGDSPFMNSLIVIIMLVFLAAGLAFGRGARTIKGSADVLGTITKSWATLASLLFLFLLIAQFIAYFNFSNIAEVLAVKLGDVLERLDIGAVWLLIGVILITTYHSARDRPCTLDGTRARRPAIYRYDRRPALRLDGTLTAP
jgi:p-aminobenzoyl-glutamate transporter AbgT